ncbi:protein CLT1, chloroplastic-like [Hordeum vulgare subsp. vulgare]|uniref:protein CLT1, chloroplastic-like n=1 Tax=Hordeum vulgare subsp. vulgare TaxID=112509 RepID=UPI001D1A4B06|nr:protein CLT1, chloroplastic-like [Hordeum vulgare subsp. vulgare]
MSMNWHISNTRARAYCAALVGPAGVGKTAIVEGLTQRIAAGNVPDTLVGARIVEVDMGSMVAGTHSRGMFEQRFKDAIKQAKEAQGKGRPRGRHQHRAVTVALAVMNRVLYKLALVPMKNYPFFLAQVLTFGYVAVYFSVLFVRYQAGIVTREMLALPKSRFMLIGLLEAMGVASGMAAASMLPGPSIPVLSQSFLVWQLILSVIVLGRKYRANQILGCLLVTTGGHGGITINQTGLALIIDVHEPMTHGL